MMRRATLTLFLCGAICRHAAASDQSVPAAESAYASAAEGLAAYKSGHFDVALERYSRAHQAMKLPALALHIARCHQQLGQWTQALLFYKQAGELPDGVGDPVVQERARAQAQAEMLSLLQRMPRVVLRTKFDVRPPVAIDGAAVGEQIFGDGWLVDPGEHRITAGRSGELQMTWQVTMLASQRTELVYTKLPTGTAHPDGAAIQRDLQSPSGVRTAGWIGLTVGALGLATWGVTGLIALKKSHDLDALNCGGSLPPCPSSETTSYDHYKLASTVSFYSGVAAVAAGATLLLAAPKPVRNVQARVVPWIGVASMGVRGDF